MKCTFSAINRDNNAETVSVGSAHGKTGADIVNAPPSKSIAHRMLIAAAMTNGTSRIAGLELSEDVLATIDCLKALGADIELEASDRLPEDYPSKIYTATVKGVFSDPDKIIDDPVLNCRESGSTLRFLIPVCTLMFSYGKIPANKTIRLNGAGNLLHRPLDVYADLFKYTYVTFTHNNDYVEVEGYLNSGEYSMPGNVSSQFVTGMLMTLPKLKGNSRLHIIPPIESRPYIDITIDVLRSFGIEITWENEETLYIKGDQDYVPADMTVEGDWSNGAILYTMAVLHRKLGKNIVLMGLREESLQGDKAITELLPQLDAGKTVDISDCPDLGPILATYAATIGGGHLTGTKRLAIKESDRGRAMKAELAKMGVTVVIEENDVYISCPDGLHAPTEVIDGHNDHRVVMSMAVLCSVFGGTIDGCEAVNKSFPSFFDIMKDLGYEPNIENTDQER